MEGLPLFIYTCLEYWTILQTKTVTLQALDNQRVYI